MSQMKQNQGSGTPSTGRNPLEQGGDDRAKHLAEGAKKLQQQAQEVTNPLDPRRSMPIHVEYGTSRSLLFINGTLWGEVDYSRSRSAFCIQDCLGYCLSHVEHIVHTISTGEPCTTADQLMLGMHQAVEVAKQMIKDGRMPTPEEAKQFAIKNNTSARKYYNL